MFEEVATLALECKGGGKFNYSKTEVGLLSLDFFMVHRKYREFVSTILQREYFDTIDVPV